MPHTATDFVAPLFTASSDDDAPTNDNAELIGPAILRAKRRLLILERLTQIGMDITEALHGRVIADGVGDTVDTVFKGETGISAKFTAPKTPCFDATDAFAKISRTVRLTLNLGRKADEALRALRSGQFLALETRKAERKYREEVGVIERGDPDNPNSLE